MTEKPNREELLAKMLVSAMLADFRQEILGEWARIDSLSAEVATLKGQNQKLKELMKKMIVGPRGSVVGNSPAHAHSRAGHWDDGLNPGQRPCDECAPFLEAAKLLEKP